MKKKTITVQGLEITINEKDNIDYVSLTDIARQSNDEPRFVIRNWMKNSQTLRFLWTWETLYNPNFKGVNIDEFIGRSSDHRYKVTPKVWIDEFNAIGIVSNRGRGGGTYAHSNIALEFCSWLSPEFKVYILREFERLKQEEAKQLNFEWHIRKITNNIDEVRNLLDTIPGQIPDLQRIKPNDKDKKE